MRSSSRRQSPVRSSITHYARRQDIGGRGQNPQCRRATPRPTSEPGLIAQRPGKRAFSGAAPRRHRRNAKPYVRPLAPQPTVSCFCNTFARPQWCLLIFDCPVRPHCIFLPRMDDRRSDPFIAAALYAEVKPTLKARTRLHRKRQRLGSHCRRARSPAQRCGSGAQTVRCSRGRSRPGGTQSALARSLCSMTQVP